MSTSTISVPKPLDCTGQSFMTKWFIIKSALMTFNTFKVGFNSDFKKASAGLDA